MKSDNVYSHELKRYQQADRRDDADSEELQYYQMTDATVYSQAKRPTLPGVRRSLATPCSSSVFDSEDESSLSELALDLESNQQVSDIVQACGSGGTLMLLCSPGNDGDLMILGLSPTCDQKCMLVVLAIIVCLYIIINKFHTSKSNAIYRNRKCL